MAARARLLQAERWRMRLVGSLALACRRAGLIYRPYALRRLRRRNLTRPAAGATSKIPKNPNCTNGRWFAVLAPTDVKLFCLPARPRGVTLERRWPALRSRRRRRRSTAPAAAPRRRG